MQGLACAFIFLIAAASAARADFVAGPMPEPVHVQPTSGEPRSLAQQGDAAAQYVLGRLHEDAVAEDLPTAARWYAKAAAQGHVPAQVRLGLLYAKGRGIGQDFAQAFRWFLTAAFEGNAAAQNNLGWMHLNGLGVTSDDREAALWFDRAAAQGEPEAQNWLGWLYMYGRGVARDFAQAEGWLRRSAEEGGARTRRLARANLGELARLRKTAPPDSGGREMVSAPRAPVKTAPVTPSPVAEAAAGTGLTIRITETPVVSQPQPFAAAGETVIVPRTRIEVDEGEGAFVILRPSESGVALAQKLNALGISPAELATMLGSLNALGALGAGIEVK